MAGTPTLKVTQELLDAHVEVAATRAINKLMRSKIKTLPNRSSLPTGTNVWVFYNTSAQNDHAILVEATVVKAHEHFLLCRRAKKGPPMRVAYEDLRIAPKSRLATDHL